MKHSIISITEIFVAITWLKKIQNIYLIQKVRKTIQQKYVTLFEMCGISSIGIRVRKTYGSFITSLVETLISCKMEWKRQKWKWHSKCQCSHVQCWWHSHHFNAFEKLKWARTTFSNHSRFSIDEIRFRWEINVAQLLHSKLKYKIIRDWLDELLWFQSFSLCKIRVKEKKAKKKKKKKKKRTKKKNVNTKWRKMHLPWRKSLSVKSFANYFDGTKFLSHLVIRSGFWFSHFTNKNTQPREYYSKSYFVENEFISWIHCMKVEKARSIREYL